MMTKGTKASKRLVPWMVAGLAVLICASTCTEASLCTDACNTNMGSDPPGYFCGTDNVTYYTTQQAFHDNNCYPSCGVSVFYAGQCGCPNSCGSAEGHGTCVASVCQCSAGWGGADCMSVSCPLNNCSGNGVCVKGNTSSAAPDSCSCAAGYTGPYCGDQVPSFPFLQDVIPGSRPPFAEGYPYPTGQHPFYNNSAIATVRFEVAPADLVYVLDSCNVFNGSWVPANVTFDNGGLRRFQMPASIHVKGATSRLDMKKGWNVKLKTPIVSDVKEFGMKCGSSGDDSALMPFLYTYIGRAVSGKLPRMGFAILYINNVFIGLYEFDETPDSKEYLTSRYGSSAGDLYKLSYRVGLKYQGNDSAVYLDQKKYRFCGNSYYLYEGKNFSIFIDFLEQINNVSGKHLQLPQELGVDDVIRELVTESFIIADDNLATGNNYYLFYSQGKWEVIVHDFDSVMLEQDGDDVCKNVYCYVSQYWKVPDEHGNKNIYPNSLISTVFAVPANNATFTYYMGTFLQQLFPGVFANASSGIGVDSAASPSVWGLAEIYAEMARIISPWYQRDQLGQLAFATTYTRFQWAVNSSVATLRSRSAMVAAEVGPPQLVSGSSPADEDLTRALVIAVPLAVIALLVIVVAAGCTLRKKRRSAADEEDYRMLE